MPPIVFCGIFRARDLFLYLHFLIFAAFLIAFIYIIKYAVYEKVDAKEICPILAIDLIYVESPPKVY